ncbi:hypothetical protein [Candidatus Electronema sp. PJ]|uniref:hypothetical protein n=1 Tax=Candidatus Electronema sp. PJ TaxID=3401572 RepID=UPI003AA8ADE9
MSANVAWYGSQLAPLPFLPEPFCRLDCQEFAIVIDLLQAEWKSFTEEFCSARKEF